MRIRAIHTLKLDGVHHAPGVLADADDAVAVAWIVAGDAEPVTVLAGVETEADSDAPVAEKPKRGRGKK